MKSNVPDLKHQYIEECWNEVRKEQVSKPNRKVYDITKQKKYRTNSKQTKTVDRLCAILIIGIILVCLAIFSTI